MSELGPGPEETDGEDWVEPSNNTEQTEIIEPTEANETLSELVIETEGMAELRRQAMEARGKADFLETGYFRDNFLEPYMLLAENQLPPEATDDQRAQAALEIATLKGLFYHDVGLHTNADGMIKVQKFAFDRLGRPDLLATLSERIATGRAERAAQVVAPEPIDPMIVEGFMKEISLQPTGEGDEFVDCHYQTEDNDLLARLVRENVLPRLSGSSAVLVRGDSLSSEQLQIVANEMLRTDFPVIAVYDASVGRYRIRYSEGDEALGSYYKPR